MIYIDLTQSLLWNMGINDVFESLFNFGWKMFLVFITGCIYLRLSGALFIKKIEIIVAYNEKSVLNPKRVYFLNFMQFCKNIPCIFSIYDQSFKMDPC